MLKGFSAWFTLFKLLLGLFRLNFNFSLIVTLFTQLSSLLLASFTFAKYFTFSHSIISLFIILSQFIGVITFFFGKFVLHSFGFLLSLLAFYTHFWLYFFIKVMKKMFSLIILVIVSSSWSLLFTLSHSHSSSLLQ
jgi:hypothetical protein